MESPLWHGRLSYLGVASLRGEALRQAIVNPARDVGVRLEPELVTQLLADAGSEPGVLPLLQETLGQLWDRRQGQTLTLADYQALGEGDRSGLAVALARRADAVLRPLAPAQEAIARRIYQLWRGALGHPATATAAGTFGAAAGVFGAARAVRVGW